MDKFGFTKTASTASRVGEGAAYTLGALTLIGGSIRSHSDMNRIENSLVSRGMDRNKARLITANNYQPRQNHLANAASIGSFGLGLRLLRKK